MWSRGPPLFSAAPQDLDVPNALTSEVRTQPPVAEASRFGRQPVVAARPALRVRLLPGQAAPTTSSERS